MKFSLTEVLESIQKLSPYLPVGSLSNRLRFGEHKSRLRSRGHDFYQIRPYDPERDEVSQILWHLRDTHGHPFVREAQASKEFVTVALADLSASVCFGAGYPRKQRMLLETVGNLGLTCLHGQDPFGFIGFAEEVIFGESPCLTQNHIYFLVERLYDFFQGIEGDEDLTRNLQKGTDFFKALGFFARHYAQKQCFLVLISDFVGFEEVVSSRLFKDIAGQQEVICVFLDDPEEFKNVSRWGYVRRSDLEGGGQALVAGKDFGNWGREVRNCRQSLRRQLRDVNVDSVVLEYGKHHQRLIRFLIWRRESFKTGQLR